MHKLSLGSKTVAKDKKSMSTLVEDLQKSVMVCEKRLNGISAVMKWFVGIQEKLDHLEKKVKVLERK